MAAANFALFVAILQVFQGCIATPVDVQSDQSLSNILEKNGFLSWFEECSNLTVAYNDMYNYTTELAPWLFDFSVVVGSDLSALLSCSGLLSTVPCVVENLEKVKQDFLDYEPDLVKWWREGLTVLEELSAAMESCFLMKTSLHALQFVEEMFKH